MNVIYGDLYSARQDVELAMNELNLCILSDYQTYTALCKVWDALTAQLEQIASKI